MVQAKPRPQMSWKEDEIESKALADLCIFVSKNDDTGLYSHLAGVPKALLPGTGGKKILDFWWETVNV